MQLVYVIVIIELMLTNSCACI